MTETPHSNQEKEQMQDEEKTIMKIVCAWCEKDLGTKEVNSGSGAEITHGVCPECAKKVMNEYRDIKEKEAKEKTENEE